MRQTLEKIKQYHLDMGYDYSKMTRKETMQALRNNVLALHTEATELLDSFPWKPWRPMEHQTLDINNAKEELVDCLFFLGAIAEIAGITPAEWIDAFENKLTVNYLRLDNGYSEVEGGDNDGQ